MRGCIFTIFARRTQRRAFPDHLISGLAHGRVTCARVTCACDMCMRHAMPWTLSTDAPSPVCHMPSAICHLPTRIGVALIWAKSHSVSAPSLEVHECRK
mmetsp:Transcript_62118/g.138389  ORF Transcript_62118/g.138389 Transcript_62118/m.138389 type:complete len:99 (-) Transcript_62118:203-499(-)